MLRLLWLILVVAALATAGGWLLEHDGSITLYWLGYEIQTSVVVLLAAVLLLLMLALALYELVHFFFTLGDRLRRRRELKDYSNALDVVEQTVGALMAGEHDAARTHAKALPKMIGDSPLTHMLSAQSAQLAGDHALAKQHFSALLEHKDTEFLAIRGLLSEAQETNDHQEAIALAERAYALKPKAPGMAEGLVALYKQHGYWDKIVDLLSSARSFWSFTPALEMDMAHTESLARFMQVSGGALEVAEGSEPDKSQLAKATEAHKVDPSFAPAALYASSVAIAMGEPRKAAGIIERSWRKNPHPQLGAQYLKLFTDDKPRRALKRAKRLYSLNPSSLESNVLVAQAAIKAEEFGLARNNLQFALGEYGETKRICMLMAKVEGAGDGTNNEAGREWLMKAEHAPRHDVWVCGYCRHAFDTWDLHCGSCSSIDTIRYKSREVDILDAVQVKREAISA